MSLEESARGFFSLRYVIPGYTFILVIIGLNIFPLISFVQGTETPEAFVAILAFVTLLTGGAIGFIVSQFWWLYYNWRGALSGIKQFEGEFKMIRNKTKNLPLIDKQQKETVESILDFTLFLEENKELLRLVWRRWDIYHVLSSTSCTIIVSLIAGVGIRIYLFVFGFFPIANNTLGFAELAASILVGVTAVVLLLVFRSLANNIVTKYYPLHKALVTRNLSKNQKSLHEAFPEYFGDVKPKD
jgi:hypothetical protein